MNIVDVASETYHKHHTFVKQSEKLVYNIATRHDTSSC